MKGSTELLPSMSLRLRRLEQSYLANGGVSPNDLTEIKKLLQDNGIPVAISDAKLAESVRIHFEHHPQKHIPPHDSNKLLRSDSSCSLKSPHEGDIVSPPFRSPRSGAYDSRRRMSLSEYTALADDVRRQSLRFAQQNDEDDLETQLATETGGEGAVDLQAASQRSGNIRVMALAMTAGQRFQTDNGLQPTPNTSDDEASAYDDMDLLASRTGVNIDEESEVSAKSISLRNIQRRLDSVGLSQGISVIVGDGPRRRFKVREKVTLTKLNDIMTRGGPLTLAASANSPSTVGWRSAVQPLAHPGSGSPLSSVIDSATLFRRLGGDPSSDASAISRDRALHLLSSSSGVGLMVAEARAYRHVLESRTDDRLTFYAFLDVISDVDMLLSAAAPAAHQPQMMLSSPLTNSESSPRFADDRMSLSEGPPSPTEQQEAQSQVLPSSIGGVFRSSAATVHEAAAAFLYNLSLVNRRKSVVSQSERLRQKLRKTLNDHVARTHRDCTFVKGLVYLLRLDVQLLDTFVLRFRSRVRAVGSIAAPMSSVIASRMLRAVERVSAMLKAHQTCQVCFLQATVKHEAPPRCADVSITNFMRIPQPPVKETAHRAPASTLPRIECVQVNSVAGLDCKASSAIVKQVIGNVVLSGDPSSAGDARHHGSLHSKSVSVSLDGHGFIAKSLQQVRDESKRGSKAARAVSPPVSPRRDVETLRHDEEDFFFQIAERRDREARSAERRHQWYESTATKPAPPKQQQSTKPRRITGRHGFHF